jgi:hypothetical protein
MIPSLAAFNFFCFITLSVSNSGGILSSNYYHRSMGGLWLRKPSWETSGILILLWLFNLGCRNENFGYTESFSIFFLTICCLFDPEPYGCPILIYRWTQEWRSGDIGWLGVEDANSKHCIISRIIHLLSIALLSTCGFALFTSRLASNLSYLLTSLHSLTSILATFAHDSNRQYQFVAFSSMLINGTLCSLRKSQI